MWKVRLPWDYFNYCTFSCLLEILYLTNCCKQRSSVIPGVCCSCTDIYQHYPVTVHVKLNSGGHFNNIAWSQFYFTAQSCNQHVHYVLQPVLITITWHKYSWILPCCYQARHADYWYIGTSVLEVYYLPQYIVLLSEYLVTIIFWR